jgi:hypothetical protein
MEPTTQSSDRQNDITSLKELILKIGFWWRYLLKKWVVIVIAGLLGGGLGFTYAFLKKQSYVAELTFVVEDSKTGALSSYAGLASQFGLDLGGGAGSGIFSGDNIIQFLRSRLMVEKTLLSPVVVEGKTMSLADFYIQINQLKERWHANSILSALTIPVSTTREKFSLQQDSVLGIIYDDIVKRELIVAKPDKKLSFIVVRYASKNEEFAKSFTERLVKEAIDFYVQTKTQRSKSNVDKLQAKADSIEYLLNKKTYAAAVSQDLNLNPARSVARVGLEVETRDKVVLQTMYAEVVKNLEISKMSMAQETPIIQIVDTPILPLKKDRVGKVKMMMLGGFLAGFLTICWLFVRKLYKEVMK